MARPAYVKQQFDPNEVCYVRRPFTAGGRHFQIGDVFNWKQLSVAQRKARQLFDMGKLSHDESLRRGVERSGEYEAPEAASEAAVATPAEPESTPTPEQAPEPEPVSEPEPVVEPAPAAETAELESVETPAVASDDGLDDLEMTQLREIGSNEGVPFKLKREDLIEAIRAKRKGEEVS